MKFKTSYCSLLSLLLFAAAASVGIANAAPAASDSAAWPGIRSVFFKDRPIEDGAGVIGLQAPKRAEDAAIVPIVIRDLLPADSKRRIDKVWLIIDNNPHPMTVKIDFTPMAGPADISTRVRVNSYTHMRAVAETDKGRLYMTTRYIKASGGCSAPASKDPKAAQAHIGEMKLRSYDKHAPLDKPHQIQLLVRHPNYTGLQMNQLTRLYRPAYYVKQVAVKYDGQKVLTAQTTFGLSENPSLRFYFIPKKPGKLSVQVVDTKGKHFSDSLMVEPVQAASVK